MLGHLGLADAGRSGEQIGADRLLGSRRPARASLIEGERLDRLVLPVDDPLEASRLEVGQHLASSFETVFGGMRAMEAMVASISLTPMVFLRRFSGTSICEAPVSSITSIALSGSLRSLM